MRKALTLLLCALLALSLCACSPGVSQEEYDELEEERDDLESDIDDLEDEIEDLEAQIEELQSANMTVQNQAGGNNNNQGSGQTGPFDADAVLSQLQVTEYQWDTDYYHNVAIVIKNNSEFDLSPDISVVFYDADGKMIGTSNNYSYALGAGYEMAYVFYNDEDFASYEYQISVEHEDYYKCLTPDLSYEVSLTSDKSIIAVTNNGQKIANYVEYVVLFFNGDTIVNYSWGYCGDADSELKPGKTEYSEDYCYDEFDSVKVYLSAYAYE